MAKAKRNGEGTISQRKDGRWCGQMVWGRKPDGKMDRRSVYGATYDEARKKLNELISERDKGKKAIKNDKISVGDFALNVARQDFWQNVSIYLAKTQNKF